MKTPRIRTERRWSASDVRDLCINNSLYTRGDCRAYEKMLNQVDKMEPTPKALYIIASDIIKHSNPDLCGDEPSSIMFLLERDCVRTFFHVDGEDF